MYTVIATKKEYLHTVHKTVRHPPLGLDAGSVAVSGLAVSAVAGGNVVVCCCCEWLGCECCCWG